MSTPTPTPWTPTFLGGASTRSSTHAEWTRPLPPSHVCEAHSERTKHELHIAAHRRRSVPFPPTLSMPFEPSLRFFYATPAYEPVQFLERVVPMYALSPYYTIEVRTNLDRRTFVASAHDLDVARRRVRAQLSAHLQGRALTCHDLRPPTGDADGGDAGGDGTAPPLPSPSLDGEDVVLV